MFYKIINQSHNPAFFSKAASSERRLPRTLPILEIIFPRQGEQCPVVELSYMCYSLPKCICNGSTQTHSRKYMILLEYLHDMDENVTHPFPLLEPSLTPSSMPRSSVRKHCFQSKKFLFSKTYYRVSVKSIGQPSEVNCW